jgi:SSS family solute:Na+ symporter
LNAKGIDWFLTAVILLVVVIAGAACRKYMKGVSDFVVAGRGVRKSLALSTGLAESIGIITFARVMQQGFLHGLSYAWIDVVDMLVVAVVFGYFGVVVVKFRRGEFMTVAQYFERRYNKNVRLVAGIATACAGVLNFAVFPIVASRFLTYFLGVPLKIEILGVSIATIPTLMALLIIAALLFTNLGGMIAVMFTGFLQSLVLAAGMAIMLVASFAHVGIFNVVQGLKTNLGQSAFNPFADGSYGPLFLLWVGLNTFFIYIAFSPTMQKIASADSEKTAQAMTFVGAIFNKGRLMIMMLVGIAALVAMGANPPAGLDVTKEQWSRIAGPMFLGQILPPVANGIVLSCFLTAFLSTVAMYLLSWTSVIINDVICVMLKKPMVSKTHILSFRITLLLIAVFLFVFGIVYEPTESILEYIFLTGTMFTGIGITLVFGLYWKRINSAGAWAAIICASILPFLDLLFRRIPHLGYNIPSQYSGLATIIISITGCILFSLLFSGQVNKKTVVNNAAR